MTVGQRFARVVTTLVVRRPALWKLFRGRLTRNFDRLAPEWDATRVSRDRLRALEAALGGLPEPPHRVLDLGTGSGAAARLAAERWPAADVTGVDVSAGMVREAQLRASTDREHYARADATSLPYPDGAFDLVTLNNMIPFFDELARVTAAGGHVAIAYSLGARTPIWVPPKRLQAELARRGFAHVADFSEPPGVSLLARKSLPS
jgi:ubiquinone/menaquinone biosynthesis C-methylase UbiE